MKTVDLVVEPRGIAGKKSALRTLRESGKIPAVLYGKTDKAAHLLVDAKVFDKLIHSGLGTNMLINIKVDGKDKISIIKEVQRNLVTDKPIHIDFQVVSMTDKIEVNVPVKVSGVSPGVKNAGGILEIIMHDLKAKCLPTDIPHHFDLDVSSLQIGQGLYVRDIKPMEGVEILADANSMILNVVLPKVEEAPAAAEGAVEGAVAAPAEPEVISKGKKEKEGEEGAAPAPSEKPKK
jgi:large subunit ribosomal protein L25